MLPRSPGPSSTTRGAPVSRTASPGFTPLVSSYTWMTVLSPMIWMTSPRSCSSHELDVVHPRAESRRRDDGSRDPEDLAGPFPRDAFLPLLHRHVPCSMIIHLYRS